MKLLQRVTVEQIHAEFDAAEEKILAECRALLDKTNTVLHSDMKRKVALLNKIGAINSQPVAQWSKTIKERTSYMKVYDKISALRVQYPDRKFITKQVFEHICNKYGLIHAPIERYTKDIPEKNALEIANRIPAKSTDDLKIIKLVGIRDYSLLKKMGHPDGVFTQQEIIDWCVKVRGFDIPSWTNNARDNTWLYVVGKYINNSLTLPSDQYDYRKTEITDESGMRIAAPASHFNLKGLKKTSPFGFGSFRTVEVKDPIAFEMFTQDIYGICSKWGTADDKSYMDPLLNDEQN
jgi:hypothetical protein